MEERMDDIPEEFWPKCRRLDSSNPTCLGIVHPARWALGYRTCLNCGSPNPKRTVAPAYNKGPVMLINKADVKDIGR